MDGPAEMADAAGTRQVLQGFEDGGRSPRSWGIRARSAAAAELSAPAGAGPRDGGERGRGVDGLGDGGAGARGRGAGARGWRRVWSPVLGDGAPVLGDGAPVLGDGAASGARCSGTASGRWTAPGIGDWARRV